jgi:hypothetical protein
MLGSKVIANQSCNLIHGEDARCRDYFTFHYDEAIIFALFLLGNVK